MSAALHDMLTRYRNDIIGISCLADGADQLFARIILDLGNQLEVIVPAERYRDGLSPAAWPEYDRLLARAHSIEKLAFVESTEEPTWRPGR